jgi:hypothetical protein
MPRYRCTVLLSYEVDIEAPDQETACELAIDTDDPDYDPPMVRCRELEEE